MPNYCNGDFSPFISFLLLLIFSEMFEQDVEDTGKVKGIFIIIQIRQEGIFPLRISIVLDELPDFCLVSTGGIARLWYFFQAWPEPFVDGLFIVLRLIPKTSKVVISLQEWLSFVCGFYRCVNASESITSWIKSGRQIFWICDIVGVYASIKSTKID